MADRGTRRTRLNMGLWLRRLRLFDNNGDASRDPHGQQRDAAGRQCIRPSVVETRNRSACAAPARVAPWGALSRIYVRRLRAGSAKSKPSTVRNSRRRPNAEPLITRKSNPHGSATIITAIFFDRHSHDLRGNQSYSKGSHMLDLNNRDQSSSRSKRHWFSGPPWIRKS